MDSTAAPRGCISPNPSLLPVRAHTSCRCRSIPPLLGIPRTRFALHSVITDTGQGKFEVTMAVLLADRREVPKVHPLSSGAYGFDAGIGATEEVGQVPEAVETLEERSRRFER